jgi:Leucine-rich repeat (LRR) protein
LDKNYPKEERENVIELSISYKELEGSLDLKDFVNLELLDCSNNQLTVLDLVNCQKLKYFSCSSNKLVALDLTNLSQLEIFSCGDNYLTNLDYSFLSDKIIFLDVSNNDLPQQNLNCLSHLVSLEYLIIGNDDERKINSSIYNR